MKLCFNLDQNIQRLCFSPETMRGLAALTDLRPEAPDRLTPERLRSQAADCDAVICGWSSLPLDAPHLRLALHSAGSIRSMKPRPRGGTGCA